MGEVLSDKEIQNLLDALKDLEFEPEEIPKERVPEGISDEEIFPEIIGEMGSVVGKKDIESLLNALSCDPEEIS